MSMKTFLKKNLLWVFALIMGLGTMSFKILKNSSNTLSETWYYKYDVMGLQYDASSYERHYGPNCIGSSSVWCTIEAPEDGDSGVPDLTNVEFPTSFKE